MLDAGPYIIFYMPLFESECTQNFVMKEDILRALPVWVKLSSLQLHLRGEKSLSKNS